MQLIERAIIVVLYAMLAACSGDGGGGGGDDVSPTIIGPIFTESPTIETADEVEPNDDIEMATPLPMPSTPARPDIVIGIGDINDTSDSIDTFAFTANVGGRHFFQLCGNECEIGQPESQLGRRIATFDILDASGNVLLSTTNGPNGNFARLNVDAGIAYYFMITAGNTSNIGQLYIFAVIHNE